MVKYNNKKKSDNQKITAIINKTDSGSENRYPHFIGRSRGTFLSDHEAVISGCLFCIHLVTPAVHTQQKNSGNTHGIRTATSIREIASAPPRTPFLLINHRNAIDAILRI